MNSGEIRFNSTMQDWVITSIFKDNLGEMNFVITFYDRGSTNHGSLVLPAESSTGEVQEELQKIEEEYPIALPLSSVKAII